MISDGNNFHYYPENQMTTEISAV